MRHLIVLLIGLSAAGCARSGEPVGAVTLEPDPVSKAPPEPARGFAAMPELVTAEALALLPIEPVVVPFIQTPGGTALPIHPLRANSTVRFEPAGATSLDEVSSLTFEIDVEGARRGAELALELTANQKVPYERRTATLLLGADALQHHAFELQVAGTMIRTAQLSGTWTATFFVDGQQVSSQVFGLAP